MAPKPNLIYAPSPPPQSGGEAELRRWMVMELDKIADAMRNGRAQSLQLDVLEKALPRPQAGMVGYFKATIVGASEGSYEYRAGAWTKL